MADLQGLRALEMKALGARRKPLTNPIGLGYPITPLIQGAKQSMDVSPQKKVSCFCPVPAPETFGQTERKSQKTEGSGFRVSGLRFLGFRV